MATFNKFNAFVQQLAHGAHDFSSDQIQVALCSAANAPTAGDAVLADLTEIDYTNLVGRALTTDASEQTSGVYRFILEDFTLEADGGSVGPFRYVVAYNDDHASDGLIGWYDIGQEITLSDAETLLLDFNNTDGLFNLQ